MTAPLLLSRSEINDVSWNELIKKSEQQVIYGYSWYLDIVCNDQWKAIVWPSVDNYQIIMPLPLARKWFVEVIQQPLFCQYLGMFSIQRLTEENVVKFLDCLSKNFSYISSYHFHPSNTSILKAPLSESLAFQVKRNTTFWLSLSKSYQTIRSNYSSDRKKNVKRSIAENWTVIKSEDLAPLLNLFKENHINQISGGVHKNAFSILGDLFEKITHYQYSEVFYAAKNGRIHAGILLVTSGKKIIYLFNAADKLGRKGNARTYLINKFFEENSGKPGNFDFESPEIAAIASFYESFGADPTPYITIRRNDLPYPIREIQNWRLKRLVNTRQAPFEDSLLT